MPLADELDVGASIRDDCVKIPLNSEAMEGVMVGDEDEAEEVERLVNESEAGAILLEGKLMTIAEELAD